ncbi:TetR family transcriptional regulator [Actinoallomurus iriomotensis]|uniref:HTH-type transcriptional repressor n=1 Tax=Actinoallomurus iriomotensis TaxID=478107 RepID=A0A9W6S631_9ACTN|nr:TetR family transcriptional regulator [Actinoallomurus iriomotensis]GLY87793.1 HTH-type transcriptional repressor [Actinoallomurus iriomotensis]
MTATETKQRILDAAFAEFAEYGVAGARVDRIAKNARCNKNLIYVYFDNKETLFATVLQRHLSDAYAGAPFDPDDLPGLAGRVFDLARSNPGVYRLLAWATLERTAALPSTREQEHDRKLDLLRERQKSGAVRDDIPPTLLLMAVLALATAWSPDFPFGRTANPSADLTDDEVRDAVVRMVAGITGQQERPGA